MKNNLVIGIIIGVILSFSLNIVAENIITANQVTYNDSTVQTELDSLFAAVDINDRLGDTNKISSIGDGTVSGAISTLNSNVSELNSDITLDATQIASCEGATLKSRYTINKKTREVTWNAVVTPTSTTVTFKNIPQHAYGVELSVAMVNIDGGKNVSLNIPVNNEGYFTDVIRNNLVVGHTYIINVSYICTYQCVEMLKNLN